jgi:tetratricopeptide (TPR) repeat protein
MRLPWAANSPWMTFPSPYRSILYDMMWRAFGILAAWMTVALSTARAQPATDPLLRRQWFEARTAHFQIYSCGPTQAVARLAARLEQFRDAYSQLAGAQAVASPPIVVLAFPDHAAMAPFLPLYQGKPANLAAFFRRGSDENLIVLSFAGNTGTNSLEVIFHEFAHLLLRHNEPYWPMWLIEGMADLYSTFQVSGGNRPSFGSPVEHHLRTLGKQELMPLHELFSVTRDSPDYNERDRQGIFYAQSWLLAHYLVLGGPPTRRAEYRQLTPLLQQGLSPEAAFTNAFRANLNTMEAELRHYLAQGNFQPFELPPVQGNLDSPRAMVTRPLSKAEVCFHLGDELLRIGRFESAEEYFLEARNLAPNSPLPYEGLGLLAAQRDNPAEAVRQFQEAMKHGQVSFLSHYTYAREKYLLTSHPPESYSRLSPEAAEEIRSELKKSLALMPDFGPAHHLLGFFELVQRDDLAAAEQNLARSIQLEPENLAYPLSLAQVQLAENNPVAARRTLESLRRPYVPASIRGHAQDMLRAMAGQN